MSIPKPVESGFVAAFSRLCLVFVVSLTPCAALGAQEHDDDHDHDHLHFSHPVVTESPSPDTKLRFDYLGTRTSGLGGIHESIFRIEGEYGFNDNTSSRESSSSASLPCRALSIVESVKPPSASWPLTSPHLPE